VTHRASDGSRFASAAGATLAALARSGMRHVHCDARVDRDSTAAVDTLALRELVAPVSPEDAVFVATCLHELFAPIAQRPEELRAFLDAHLRPPAMSILLLEVDGQRAGVITLVRVPMPRYLGFLYEIEEIVVLAPFRRRGVARRALRLVEERCRQDPQARKVVIRTTEPEARRVYESVWTRTEMTSFQTMLNLLDGPPPETKS